MRQRWVQIDGKLVPVGQDYEQPDASQPGVFIIGDKNYEGLRSPIDGADISTKTKHRTYMKDKNLAIADDFKGVWKKAAEDRVAGKDPTRKQAVIDAVNKHYRR